MKKRILVVGGSHGIGSSLLQQLSAEGHELINFSRTAPEVSGIHHFQVDVVNGDLPEIEGALDGIAYCPGSINLKPFKALKLEHFREDLEINFLSAVKVLQQYEKNLKASEKASVVLFSTVAVGTGMPFHASIAGAKGAVEGLGKSLAAEWAPKVRVNVIAPSLTDTPLAERLLRNDRQRDAAVDRHPLKSIGQANDMAAMASFLLTDQSNWITGQVLHIDGGMSSVRI
jgi:NAD(P)-dependent dehydrogenase (short-subunit alcohol dehydrogenase family)